MSPEVETGRGTPAEPSQEVPHGAPLAPAGMSGGPPGIRFRVLRDERVLFLVGGVNTVVGTLWFTLFDLMTGTRLDGFGHDSAVALTDVFAILCASFCTASSEDFRDPARVHLRRRPRRAAPHPPPGVRPPARLEPYVRSTSGVRRGKLDALDVGVSGVQSSLLATFVSEAVRGGGLVRPRRVQEVRPCGSPRRPPRAP